MLRNPFEPEQRLTAEPVAGLGYVRSAVKPPVHRVEVHVKHILSKLGFHSRSQIAVWMAEQHLNGAT